MSHTRVIFYIDGFNLYHALVGLGKPHLKWVNLRKLCQHFVSDPRHYIEDIYYFSAYANRGYKVRERHEAYIQALESVRVKFILGKFKKKIVSANSATTNGRRTKKNKQMSILLCIFLTMLTKINLIRRCWFLRIQILCL